MSDTVPSILGPLCATCYVQPCVCNLAPWVGMPATICYWSDRAPAHVSYVSPSGKTIRVREAHCRPVDIGFRYHERQEYVIEPDPEGHERTFTLRKDGRWRERGGNNPRLSLGVASRYHDPHF